MTWLVIRAFLGGTLQKVWAFLCHRSFWQLMFGAALLLAGWEYLGKRTEQRHANKSDAQLIKCSVGRQADRAAYEVAQRAATSANLAQVHRVEQRQQEINNAKVGYLTGRLQLISDELRRQNAAAESAPRSAPASPGVESPCRVIDPAWMCLSPADRLLAAQNEERHDELIDLVLEQSAVDPNKVGTDNGR